MNILDAIEQARQRNAQRDQFNAARAPIMQSPILQAIEPMGGISDGGGWSAPTPDTRTPAQQYADAIAMNRSPVVGLPVIGMPIGLMNNAFIRSFEEKNPDLARRDPNRMYRSLFDQIMDAVTGRSNANPFGLSNIGAFPSRSNFGSYGDAFSGGPNADIGGSIDTTDQSPSVGVGDNNGTAVA